MDFETKKKYYNLCDPFEPLEPDDDRNLDFDKIGAQSGKLPRGKNWADELLEDIILPDNLDFAC